MILSPVKQSAIKLTPREALPIEGDPNTVRPATAADVGRIAVRTDNGWHYQCVKGGAFTGSDNLVMPAEILDIDPNTASCSVFFSTRLLQTPSNLYGIFLQRVLGIGCVVAHTQTGLILMRSQVSTSQAYVIDFTPANGLSINVAFSWDHTTQEIRGKITGEAIKSSNSLSAFVATTTNRQMTGLSSGGHYTPFLCRKSVAVSDAELTAFCDGFALPASSACDLVLDTSSSVLSTNSIPNLGTAGGFWTLTDISPAEWNSTFWKRIK